MRVGWMSVALAVCLRTTSAAAQRSAVPTYTVAGSIVDGSHDAVPDASIEVLDGETIVRRLRSDSAGKFLATGLTVRAVAVRVRRFGYQPKTVDVAISDGERRASVLITLEATATRLGTTNVTADESPGQRLREFYERMASNKIGTYLDPESIDRRRASYVSEILRSVPGITLRPSATGGNAVTIRGCSPLVWVDGGRVPRGELDDVVQAADVAAIEIYRSTSGVPAQYFDRTATCGTILVWTKLQ